MRERPAWSAVEASLDQFEAADVRAQVLAVLSRKVPDAGRTQGVDAIRELRATLAQSLGTWYALGPTVGDETVSGWCWCHSFWAPFKQHTERDERLEAMADSVMAEIELCRQWRLRLARWFWDRKTAGTQDEQLQSDLVELVGLVVELGVHDAWYVHIEPAVTWYLEATGNPVPDALVETLEALAETHFTSWVSPGPKDRQTFAEAAAWAVFEKVFDRAYPGDSEP